MKLQSSAAKIILAFALVYIVWGSTYLAIRFAVEDMPPFLMAGARFFIGGFILYLWTRWRGNPSPSLKQWGSAAAVGTFLLLGGNGAVVWAEQTVDSGVASLIVATVPLWMVLMEWFFDRKHKPDVWIGLGLVLGFAGIGLLVKGSETPGYEGSNPAGIVALIFASISWAFGSFLARRLPLPSSPFLATGMEMIAGGAVLLVAATVVGEWNILHFPYPLKSTFAFLYLVVFGSLVGFTAYIWLLGNVSMASVSTYAFVNPVIAVLLGWALAGEEMTPEILGAIVVIVAGVGMIIGRQFRKSIRS